MEQLVDFASYFPRPSSAKALGIPRSAKWIPCIGSLSRKPSLA